MKQKHGRKSKLAALLAACALIVSAMIAGGTLSVSADAGEAKENVGGKFLISGGTAANGDYSYNEETLTLTVLKSTPITIQSVNKQFVNAKIFIANGVDANITLDSLRIETTDGAAISMGDSSANVTITLKGGTSNCLNGVNAAGIEKLSKNGRLTITCEHADEENHQCDMNCGMLDARCIKGHGAGIGASGINGAQTGGIYIKGGMISAAGTDGAGIGGSNLANVSDINISGGIIEAHGYNGAAGIGSAINGSVDSINISGGTISAYGSEFRNSSGNRFYGAAIGAAYCSSFNSINISGGTIYANTAYGGSGTGAVAVGAGNSCNPDRTGIIRISDGVVYAVGSGSADAIGVSDSVANPADIVIDGGSVYPKCGDKCTVHSGKIGMSSLPKDSSGRELILLEIDNPNDESITVNGKAYPSNSTYKTDLISSSTKVDKSYVFMPKSGRNSVTVGDTTTDYIYSENGLVSAENLKLDFYATDSNKPLVYGTDYKIDDTTLTILSDKGITIKNVDPAQPCSNYIYIESDVSANITFAGINIQRGLNEYSAVEIAENSSGNVNIILADNTDNIISTSYNYAALSKNSDSTECGTLTISCQHSGEAGHICGSSCGGLNAASSNYPAAIGGDYNKSASNIVINGGRIEAKTSEGAGIGGGYAANANNITVNGGIINAESIFGAAIGSGQGGSADGIYINGGIVNAVITYFDNNNAYGCAIGSGATGQADNIIINNGIVTAQGGYNSYALGGWSNSENTRNYRINGGMVYLVNDKAKNLKPFSSDAKLKNNNGEYVYLAAIINPNGEEITINGNPQQYRFLSSSDMTFYAYVPKDIAGTASVKVGNKQYSYGLNEGIFEEMGSDLVIIKGDNEILEYGLDYTYPAKTGILTVNNCAGSVTIKNADESVPTNDRIYIGSDEAPSTVNITLAGVNISYPSMWTDSSALCIANDNTASITLADGTTNTLISDSMYGCGIAKDGTGTLIITCEKAKNDFSHKCDESCGTLSAKANMYGSAIGSTSGQYNGKTAQNITILGGNITAASKHGAAIGGGIYTGADNITVSGGNINATGGGSSAAIGSGEKNSSSSEAVTAENIKILGGNINAVGGFGAAAIGGGKESSASSITIANANVKAVTDDYSAAIGGGRNANGKNIRIENSTLYAASQSGAAIIGGGVNGTGDKIYIENSVVSLVQKGSCGPDMIGNGVDGVASEIYIDNSSVAMYSTSTFRPDISQNSRIKNSAGEPVYLLTVDNPNGDEVIVDGVMAIAANNIAADPSDTGLHLWLADRDHSLILTGADGATTQIDYHFNDLSKVFKLCEADIDDGYRYNETAHWYICKNSDLCTVKFNYQNHLGGNATCTNKAICEACGVEYGDPLGHNKMYFDYVPETCTTDGHLPYYYCDRCDKYFGRETDSLDTELNVFIIPATGHDMTKVDAVPASCEADGNIEYYKCGYCGKFFSDADGKNEITAADTVIAAAGHRYLTSWTFDSDSHWHKCEVCGSADTIEPHVSSGEATETAAETCTICGYEIAPMLGHIHADNLMPVSAVKPTCTKDGNIDYYVCSCGRLFADADGKNEITAADTVIAATGHHYLTSWTFDSSSHWHECDVCGSADKIEPHVSSGNATETAAETCTICGYEIAPMLEHIHASHLMPVYAVKPTCTKEGNIDYYVCSCGRLFADSNAEATLSEADIVIPAAGHGATEIRNRVEPTETANGYTGDEYCTVCNELVKRGTVIPTTAPSETTPTPSETPTAPSETTPTPSENPTAPSETTPTPSETPTAPSETTPTPSETSAATTFPPENAELPFIKDEDSKTGWEVINSRLADTDEGGRVIVEMNGSTDVHEETFALIKGKDITLVLDMGNGFSWEINGNDVDSPKNVNLSVTPDADIPVKVINRLTGECYCTSFTLEYSGEFGFIAKLSMGLGKENKGLYANLYYYLGDDEFEFIGSAKVNSEGVAKLSLSHASDYVVIVDETDHAADNESGDAEKPESGETDHAADNESGDAEKPESNETNHGTGVVVFGLIAVIILAAAVTVVLSRKKKQK